MSFLCPSPKRCHQCTSAHILWQSLCHLSTPEPATAGGHTALLGEDHGPSPRPAVRVAWEPLRMTDTRAPPESLNGPALAVTLTLLGGFQRTAKEENAGLAYRAKAGRGAPWSPHRAGTCPRLRGGARPGSHKAQLCPPRFTQQWIPTRSHAGSPS